MVLKALGYIIASVATSKVQFWSPYKTWCYPTVYKADKITSYSSTLTSKIMNIEHIKYNLSAGILIVMCILPYCLLYRLT